MVNYKRVVCEVAVFVTLVSLALAAPTPDCDKSLHYDQRQNGTENYRLNIDGVVIAVAPAESLLSAAAELDLSDLIDLEEFDITPKPKPPPDYTLPSYAGIKPEDQPKPEDKPQDSSSTSKPELSDVSMSDGKEQKKEGHKKGEKAQQRLKMRLANLLLPLLRRNRHH